MGATVVPMNRPFGIIKYMEASISYDREQETPEGKARWFQSLSIEERMELLCEYTDLILSVNPRIADMKNAEQTSERIRILSAP
jgi:hypothetical protein